MNTNARGWMRRPLAAALLAAAAATAHAGLFDDDEARRAILDLRNKIAQGEQRQAELQSQNAALTEQIQQLRRSLLEISNQLETMRAEVARQRGGDEQLAREVAELQRRQRDIAQGVDERIRRFEPQKVTLDGKEFLADPEEKRAYDESVAPLRAGDFAGAATALSNFLRRYPSSGYADSVKFWLGNAQYGKREYKEAIATFRNFVATAPQHMRAPEALLAIANTQAEMKDSRAARRTLDELLKAYPQSEAAQAGRERLASLK